MLQRRQADQLSDRRVARRTAEAARPAATHAEVAALRKELNGLVAAWHHRSGQPHGAIHAELRRVCGGPLTAQADVAQLQQRVERIRQWAVSRA